MISVVTSFANTINYGILVISDVRLCILTAIMETDNLLIDFYPFDLFHMVTVVTCATISPHKYPALSALSDVGSMKIQ